MTSFVAADAAHPDYGNLASLLLAVNEELGYHVREVRTVPGGFEVPDAVHAQLEPDFTPDVPAVAPSGEKLPPPAWWSEPEPEVDVTFEDGKYYAAPTFEAEVEAAVAAGEPDREAVRAWARENGHEVADKGQLKKVIYEAYAAAQGE